MSHAAEHGQYERVDASAPFLRFKDLLGQGMQAHGAVRQQHAAAGKPGLSRRVLILAL